MMLLMRIDRWDVRRDGPLSEAALQRKLQALGYQVTARTYSSGSASPTCTDSKERIEAVVHGLVKVSIDGEAAILTAGDVVYVPRGAVRRVEVVGTNSAHCLEAVYQTDEDEVA
ncbi:MAG: hypothetical protein A3G21_10390 [Acidobacteria bacterium RIFCSPLOWO2_12_FULL_66_21]|nr:MAG: hypothetical protein A3G21_10390 [Acidobacteria bacterium RIFCSPLOWO2_12_FULL_66_21]